MSLNDEVLNDPTLGSDNENVIANTTGNINSVIDQVEEKQDSNAQDLLNLLVSADISAKGLFEQQDKISELTELKQEIVAKESISRFDAELIHQYFGNFIHPKLSLEEFTPLPSQTNFIFSKRFMNEAIAREQAELVQQTDLFLNKVLIDVRKSLIHIRDTYLDNNNHQLSLANACAHTELNNIADNKNAVVANGELFSNLFTVDLAKLDVVQLGLAPKLKEELSALVTLLHTLTENTYVKNFIAVCVTNKAFEEIFNLQHGVDLEVLALSGELLANFIKSGEVEDYNRQLAVHLKELIITVDKVLELQLDATGNEELTTYLTDHRAQLQRIINESSVIVNLALNSHMLYRCLHDLFRFYSKL